MADDLETKDQDQTQTVEQQTQATDQTSTTADQQGDDKKGVYESITGFIKDKLGKKSDDSASEDSISHTDIPRDFSDVAEALGWTSEDIIEFATSGNEGKPYTDEELMSMVADMETELNKGESGDTKTGAQTKPDDKKDESELTDEEKVAEALTQKVLEKLGLKNAEELKELTQQIKEDRDSADNARLINKANELFDAASKDIKVLGLTKDLPKYSSGTREGEYMTSHPSFKVRSGILDDAIAFMKHRGLSIDDAMSKALNAYRGEHLKDNIRTEIVKELKDHEQNLSGPRTAKEVKKTYDSSREEEIDYIRGLQRAAGQDV